MPAGRILVRDLIALDGNGKPYAGALLYTYVPTTTTLRTTYTTSALSVEQANPVVADAGGKFGDIWADINTPFRVVVKNSTGAVTLNDTDNLYPQGAATNAAPQALTTTTALDSGDLNSWLTLDGTFTLTLPLGSGLPTGWAVTAEHIGDGTEVVTLATSGGDTCNVSAIYPGDIYHAEWNGTAWRASYLAGGQGKHMIPVLASSMRPQTTNGAALTVIEMSTNKQMVASFDFDASTQEYAQFSLPMPASWDEGSVYFEAVWAHPATTTNFGVAFSLQAIAYSNDDAIDAAWGSAVTVTDTGGTTSDLYISPLSAAVTVAGTPQAGDTVYFRASREVGDAGDTVAVDAKLLAIRLYVTTNAPNDR